MNIEIERKFLIQENWKEFFPNIINSYIITQCYIFSDLKSSMRIRKIENQEIYVPEWFLEEVTSSLKYFNCNMI